METITRNHHAEEAVFSYCDHCGFAIYDAKDAVCVHVTRDIIHKDCWSDYSDEHMFDLAENVKNAHLYDRDG